MARHFGVDGIPCKRLGKGRRMFGKWSWAVFVAAALSGGAAYAQDETSAAPVLPAQESAEGEATPVEEEAGAAPISPSQESAEGEAAPIPEEANAPQVPSSQEPEEGEAMPAQDETREAQVPSPEEPAEGEAAPKQEEANAPQVPSSQEPEEGEAAPKRKEAHAPRGRGLLENGGFSDWDDKGPSEWDSISGTTAKRAGETWEGRPVLQIDPQDGLGRQVEQWLGGVEKQIRGGDTIRFETRMRCQQAEKADIFISRQYEVDGKTNYTLDRQYAEGDGNWHLVVVETRIDPRELSGSSALRRIRVGIRGEEGLAKPIYAANAALSIEREEDPPQDNTPVGDPAHLLKNADFGVWSEKGPAAWNVGSGLAAKKARDTLDSKAVAELTPIPGKTNGLFYQYLNGLAPFVRAGDMVHIEMRVKLEKQAQAVLFMDLGYEVDGDMRWTGLQNACPADGGWHTVALDWIVGKERLPQVPKLRSIRGGIRSEGTTANPFFIAGARAWVVSTGL